MVIDKFQKKSKKEARLEKKAKKMNKKKRSKGGYDPDEMMNQLLSLISQILEMTMCQLLLDQILETRDLVCATT